MKKFMIFLLMTVLYLGTCQARSEASHPNNGKLKLLSWVSPTPSESFLTPASAPTSPMDVKAGDGAFEVSIVGLESGCPDQDIILTAVVDGPVSTSDPIHYVWKVDGDITKAVGATDAQTYGFKPQNLPVLNDGHPHEITVEVSWGPASSCVLQVSPVFYFKKVEPATLSLTLPDYVCKTGTTTLAALITNAGPAPATYKWFVDDALVATTTTNEYVINNATLTTAHSIKVFGLYEFSACNTDTVKVLTMPSNYPALAALELKPDTTVCAGSPVALTVTDPNTTYGTATYTWHVNGTEVASVTGNTYTATFDAAGNYEVVVTGAYENYPCGTVADTVNVTVNAAPALAIVGDNVICAGQESDTIIAVSTPKVSGSEYVWTKPDGTTTAASADSSLNAILPGHYLVTMTTPATYGACTATAEFTVYQFGGQLQLSATQYNVCPGEVIALNGNLEGWTNENIHHQWTIQSTGATAVGATNASVMTVQVDASATGALKFTDSVYVDGVAGCSMVDTITVNVIAPTAATYAVSIDPEHVCEGGQVKAKATLTGTYTGLVDWFVNGVQVPGEHDSIIVMNMNQAGTYTFAAAPANTVCAAAVPGTAGTVKVDSIPVVTITGNNVICNGASTTITASPIPASDSYSYSWSGPKSGTDKSLSADEPGVYSVLATNTATGCHATASITITQLGADLQVYASEQNVCPNSPVMLNANLDGFGNENIQYAWDGGWHGSTITVTPAATTTYKVTASTLAYSNCQIVDSIKVYVIDETPATFNVTVLTDLNICEGGVVTVAASEPGNYTWYMNGLQIPGQTLDTISLNLFAANTYAFTAVRHLQCSSDTVTADDAVTVHAAPEVTVVGNNVVCNGDTAYMRAVVVPSTTTYDYAWEVPAGVTPSTDSIQKTVVAGVYTVNVTDPLSNCTASAVFTVYSNGGNLQLTVDNNAICLGETVVLNANLTGFNNENIEYAWTGNGLGTIATGSQVTATPTADGEQTYVVTTTAGNNCEMKDSVIVNVTKGQKYETTVALATYGLQYICQGADNHFVATSTPAASAYVWYLDGLEIPGEHQSLLTLQMNNPGLHTLAAKAVVNGCDSATVSENYTFYVTPIPAVTLSGNNVICNGDTAVIVATADTTNVPLWTVDYTFAWSDGTIGDTLKTIVAGIYTVTITDTQKNANCHSTASIEVVTFGGNLQLNADRTVTCAGQPVVLNANIAGFNNENIVYAWSTNDTASTITVFPLDTTTYVVTAVAGNCSMVDSITIYTEEIPANVNLTASADSICLGEQVTLTADGNANSYIWYQNGIVIPGENQNTLTLNFNEVGQYYYAAKAVSANGCVSALASTPDTITVNPIPVVTLTGDHYYTTDITSANIVATVFPAGNYTYEWSNGETRTGANHDTLTVSAPGGYGVYTVTVTSANGCMVISDPFTVSSVVDLQAYITGAEAACQHDVVTLSAVVDYDLEGHTYRWLVNNQYITDANGITGSTTPHLVFPVDSLYQNYGQVLANEFTVEIVRPGCDSVVKSPVHPFLITPVPYVYVAAPEKVCKGNGVTLEAVVYQIGANAQYQYIWFKDGAAVATIDYVNTYDVPADQIEGHKYAVQVIYQNIACNSDTSAEVEIPFYVEPGAITISLDPTTICTTNQARLGISDTNANKPDFGAAYYTWYVNGIEMPLVHGDTLIADFDHNGEYTFWATAQYENYPCALNYTDTITENVVMHPTVAITGDPIICNSDTINLYAVINDSVGTMSYTYEWRLYNYSLEDITDNNFAVGSSSASNYVNNGNTTFNVSGSNDPWLSVFDVNAQDYPYVYTVVVTTPEGCRVESDPYLVYVNDTIKVVATVDYDSVCSEGMITAVAHLGNWNADNLTAQWQYSVDNGATWNDIDYGTSGVLQHIPGHVATSVPSIVLYRIHVVQTTSGCEAYSDSIAVKVFQPVSVHHIVAINHDDNYPTDNVCEGAQLDITAYVVKTDASGNPIQLKCVDGVTDSVDASGNPVYETYIDSTLTYMWELNGMQLQTVHGPVFSAQAYIYDGDPVDYTYTAYIVYNIPGCELVPVASNTIHVKRNPVVIIEGNHNFCYGLDLDNDGVFDNNVTLTAWVDGDYDPDATYTWYKNGEYRPNNDGYNNHYVELWEPTYDNPYEFTVEVTNGDGCTTISDIHYVNVYDKPFVHITADADSICENGAVTMHANLENYNDPMLTYQWYRNEVNDNHIIEGATNPTETFYPVLGTTNYILLVTHLMEYQQPYQSCVALDTFQIKVNPIPQVNAEYRDLAVSSICDGRMVKIAAGVRPNTGIAGGEVYTWYRNGEVINGFNGDTLVDFPTSVDNEPTVYTYAVSVKQSAAGCESQIFTLTPSITVSPNPALELTTDPIVCDTTGNNITLTANMVPTTVGSTLTYAWYEDNHVLEGFATPTTDNTISFHKDYRDYPYSFSVKTVNTYGCISEASATVYVNAEPVVHISSTDTNICVGGQITLTATLNDWNADMLTYQWYDDTVLIPGATQLSYTVVPSQGTHKYNIQIDQLTSLCHAASDTVFVNVVADPTITITYAANQYTVCDGYQVDLTTTVTGGVNGGEIYTWYRNGQVIDGATSASYSEVVSALNGEPTTYNYAVSVAQTAHAGCESNVYDQLATITVNPNPVVVLVTDPIVCDTAGNNITLTANMDPANVGSTVTFKWMEDNAVMNTADYTVVANNQITFHKDYRDYPYSFSVEVVNDYACSSSSEAQVYVNNAPVVNITVTENAICDGGEITLTATLADWNANMLTFQWFDGADSIPGATELTYTVAPTVGTHDYHVEILQLTSLCEATSNHQIVTVAPIPVIASVEVSQYNVCNGAQLNITATPTDGYKDGEVYTWYRNGILIPGAVTHTIQDTPGTIDNNIQHYVYTAVVTRPQAGCTSDMLAATATSNQVTVYPNPVVVISGDAHVCETDSVFLIANVDTTAFAVGNLHFTWYESGTIHDNMAYNLGDNRFFAEYFYPRDEPYVFTVNVERNDISAGCASMSAEYYVYVYPQPLVTVTATDTLVCTDGEVTLTANLADYNADNLIYQWYEIRYQNVTSVIGYDDNDQYIDTTVTEAYRYYIPGATMPTLTINPHETTTYGVVVYQTNSTCWNNDEITINVNKIPVVTSVTVNGVAVDTVCDGAQVIVRATINANGTDGEPVYTWYRNGVLIEGANQEVFSENVYTTDNHVTYNHYSVVVTLPHSGCVSEMSSMAGTVRINPAPSTVTISGVNLLCENDSTILTAYSDVEGEWTWSTGSHEQSIKVPAGSYTVTMKTVEGCEMTSQNFVVQAFGTDLLVSASATSICRGEHTTLYVNQDGWQGNVTYAWDAQAGNSTATTVDVQPDSTTTYHVVATVSSTNGSCSFPGEVTIIVHQLPAAFNVTASVDTICEGQQITFTAPVDPQVTGYIWYQNGVEIPGENQNVITINFNEHGNYTFAAKAISVEGCISAQASAPVTVTVNPAPKTVTITGINVLCENDSTVLTASSDVPGIFTWNDGTTGATNVVTEGVYNVTVTTAQGCSLTSENFTVESFGTDLLVSASATSICKGEHTTLFVDQAGWQGNVTYAWDAQAGNSTASTVDVQPEATTTYHVTATVTSSNNHSCTAEGEVTIIVNPLPVISGVTATDTVICQGDQVTFTATGDANTTAYVWYANGVEIPGENQASLTVNFNEAGTYNYSVKAISNENCLAAVAYNAPAVLVKPAPTTVTITGINVLCENDSTVLTAHSDVAGTFTWNDGTTGATKVVTEGVYNVTLTTAEGCHLTSDNITVESFGTDLLVSASATSICKGEHTTLYVDQDGWQGNVTYAWDAQAGNSTASTVDVQPEATTTYHVTATVTSSNNHSCTAEGVVTIIVNPLPVITGVTATDTVICQGDQVTFTATGDANTTAYIWYAQGVEIPGENQASLTVNFNEAGTYNYAVKAISNENCVAAVAYNAPAVLVKPAPTTVTITGNNVLCENDSALLTAHSDVAGTFTWNDGTTGATKVVTEGVYNVTLTTAEGCHLTSDNFTVESFGTDLLVSASATNICQGEHTTLFVNQDGWQGNVTYLWSTGSTQSTIDVQPDTTTTYTVVATVTSNNGHGCTATNSITINVNPTPAAPIVIVPQDTVCTGEQVAVAISGATEDHYYWFLNGVEIPGENMPILNYTTTSAGLHLFAARAISDQGCISEFSLPSSTYPTTHVVVIDAPESVVITGNTNFCDGGSTTLYANVTTTADPQYVTYTWFKDGAPYNSISTDHITVTTPGSYKVIATVYGLCSTESMSVDVNVEQAPQLQLTATESVICVNGSTLITAQATGWNNNDVNYSWSHDSTYHGSFFTFTPTAANTYTFTVTASQATSGCTAEDQITITVNAVPATPVVTVDHAVVCDGGQVTLTVTNAIANATYTWSKNNNVIGTGSVLYDSPVTVDGDETGYVYTVVAELPMSGCTSEASANTVVTVIPTPVVELSVDGNTTLCAGGSTTIYANVTPANPNYTYQWYKDNVMIDGATGATYTAADAARETAYNYKVVVSANAGCDVTSAPLAITFVADPQVDVVISNNISCVGGTATLTALIDGGVANVNGLNGYHFAWHRNYANSSDPNAPYSTEALIGDAATYTTSANDAAGNYTYWVTVTSAYGCETTSGTVSYSVVADPVVTITVATGYPSTVCNGGESMLKANVSGGYGEATYQWYKNNNLLVGETNQTLSLLNLTYGANDTYRVEVMQTGVGCSNFASAAINTLVTVNPNYTVDITGFGNVCEGGTLTLNATVNNLIATDVLSYQWYRIVNGNEPVAISGANAAQYSTSDLLLGNSYDYYVVVTSTISGCSVVSNSVPANVVTAPTVAIQGANTVCEGGNLTLNAFVNGGVDGAAYTYTWNWTGAATGNATTAVPTYVPTVAANDLSTPYYFTVTITRNDNTGCTATSEAHEVNVFAVPTVSVTADNNYICQNGDVTFTAHVSPVGAYNYVWTINGQQQAVNAATVTTTMATTGTINASVVVSAANASGSCSASATIANAVQVVAAPTVTLTASNTTMCVGGVTTLTATVNANPNIPGNFNYEWIVDGAPIAGVTNVLNQTINAAGIHTYKVRVSQDNNLGCSSNFDQATATVQVAEQPVVTLTSEDGLAICEGGSITLTGVVTNYNNVVNGVTNSTIYGNLVFDWTSNGVNVHHNTVNNSAMNQVTETLNTVGNYTYQVTVDAAGYNCLPQISNDYMVSVVSDPTWTDVHVYSNNGTDACLGEMVYLMADIEGGAVDYHGITGGHIQWVVSDANGNTINVSGGLGGNSYDIPAAAGTYLYTPTFIGNIGSGCQLSNTNDVQVSVTVHDLPTAEFTSGDGTALCANDPSASAALVITFTGVAPFTYEVVDDHNNVIAHATTFANTATIYVSPDHQTTYRINLISDNFCENPAIGDDITATVYVNDIQFAENFFVSGCNDNGMVTISFNMISGNPNAAFNVVYENGLQASGNISNNTATFAAPSVPGDYSAVFTVDGCSYDIVVRVLVGEFGFGGTLPIMDQRWNDVVVVNNNPQTNGGHTFVGFQWYHNGVAIPGATYSNYQDKAGLNGFYSVELTEQDANGNMITYMTCEMYFSGNSSVKVYPVPANVRQEITIELELTSEQLEGAVLDIYSVTGALINHVTDLQPITKIQGFTAQGTYFGRILTGTNEIKTVKFIIVK